MPDYTLAVATSADGFIARAADHTPQSWASAEEQALFFAHVNAADWAIMGRNTHLAADKADRHRIVFSTSMQGWQRATQLWLDPTQITAADLPGMVAGIRPLNSGLVLGGTRVHDWFVAANALSKVYLTIEPIHFHDGLPIFSDQKTRNPLEAFRARGYGVVREEVLNAAGTRYITLCPEHPE